MSICDFVGRLSCDSCPFRKEDCNRFDSFEEIFAEVEDQLSDLLYCLDELKKWQK